MGSFGRLWEVAISVLKREETKLSKSDRSLVGIREMSAKNAIFSADRAYCCSYRPGRGLGQMDYRKAFEAILADPRYQANLDWGKPRRGHPEGTIRAHIAELERNLETLRPRLRGEGDYWKLKLLIHTHDTFKPDADSGVKITSPHSHASLARAFLAEFCDDADLLTMVQLHDEPYALYRQFDHRGSWDSDRFDALLKAIRDWDLFLAFLVIDGCTKGKSRKPLIWLFCMVEGNVLSNFRATDILP